MDGLLVVDKPSGPTSHDVVARVRRALREPRIGHTGTLDPLATGVLLLVVGRATRLAKFLSPGSKSYDAVVRLGFATDTADALGQPLGPIHAGPLPARAEIEAALETFRGTFMQQPPAFSAKKIGGRRSYKLARDHARLARTPHPPPSTGTPSDLPALPAPVSVTIDRLDILSVDADTLTLTVDCSAGFYIRSLAHDLGERLGTGAHLTALRRTRTGVFTLDQAMTLNAIECNPQQAVAALVSPAAMLPDLRSVMLTPEGVNRVGHGQDIRPVDRVSALDAQTSAIDPGPAAVSDEAFVRLLDAAGTLVAIAQPEASGVLHPSIVLM
jgi:tRNA pseudouridine55 synthase